MDRKKIAWRDQAKAQLRAIDQPTALRILQALARFAATGEGDVKRLQDIEPPEFRLRVGDYRLRFHDHGQNLLRHRRQTSPRSLPLSSNTHRTAPNCRPARVRSPVRAGSRSGRS